MRAAADVLAPGGALVLEVHEGHGAPRWRRCSRRRATRDVAVTRDLAGRERVVEGRWHGDVERAAIDAIRAGEPVLLPTDGVYGLCAAPSDEAPARAALRAEGPRPSASRRR